METSGKKILGIDWIKRLTRSFTPEQLRQQYLAKPLAQQRMEEQTKRRTDEESYLEARFVRGVFAFLWNGDLDDEFPCNAPTHEWAKVIGNIYDNPKLLK